MKSEASKSLKTVRRTHSLGKNRMIILLDRQGKEIQEHGTNRIILLRII